MTVPNWSQTSRDVSYVPTTDADNAELVELGRISTSTQELS